MMIKTTYKIFSILFIMFIVVLLITACAGLQTASPPKPVVKWLFDVSKRGSSVNQEFRIVEFRSYYFALRFDYIGPQDALRVRKLVGDGSEKYPGIDIPIRIKIYRANTENKASELIYENTIMTKHKYVSGGDWPWHKGHGNHNRKIITIDLKPGIYRVEADTIEDRPEFTGTPSYLQIEWRSNVKYLPDNIK